ncbi:hypothetical protein E4U54_004166 [Claviceps lovelessii]|nr:hypothetical protein E4U54_004166 [Claviceps lovelessii]
MPHVKAEPYRKEGANEVELLERQYMWQARCRPQQPYARARQWLEIFDFTIHRQAKKGSHDGTGMGYRLAYPVPPLSARDRGKSRELQMSHPSSIGAPSRAPSRLHPGSTQNSSWPVPGGLFSGPHRLAEADLGR